MSESREDGAPRAEITKTVMFKLGYAVTEFLSSPEYRERLQSHIGRLTTEEVVWVGDRVLARIADFALPQIAQAVRYPGLKELNAKLHETGLSKDLYVGITQNGGVFENIGLMTLEEALGEGARSAGSDDL